MFSLRHLYLTQGNKDLLVWSSSRSFIVFRCYIYVYDTFWIHFYMKCKVHCFADGRAFVPMLLVVKAVISPLNYLVIFVGNQLLKIIYGVYFWTLFCFTDLHICPSANTWSWLLKFYAVLNLGNTNPLTLFSFHSCSGSSRFSLLHIHFKISLLISTKILLGF